MRFLLSRRWVLFAIVVVLLAYLAVRLGEWQFSRLSDRVVTNHIVERNLKAEPVPVDDVLAPDRPVAADEEWRRVQATGRYADDQSVVVRYQTRDGQSGVDVVTPLVTSSGTAVLVDRGWVATGNTGSTRPTVPDAPAGEVTVVGWVRADATGGSTEVEDRSTRSISSTAIGATLPFPVYGGFLDAQSEDPSPAQPLVRAETPDLSEGPHFFYGLQWWFFGALAVFGFCYLAWDERRKMVASRADSSHPGAGGDRSAGGDRADQSERSIPPSTGTMAPVTNEDAGESRKAATRPNSAGVP